MQAGSHGAVVSADATTITCIKPIIGSKERERQHVRTLKLLKQPRPGHTDSDDDSCGSDDDEDDRGGQQLARPLLHGRRYA